MSAFPPYYGSGRHGCRVATVACSCEKGRVRSGHAGVLRWSDRLKQPGQHDYYVSPGVAGMNETSVQEEDYADWLKEEGDRKWVGSQDDSGRTAQCKHTAPKLTTGAECDDVGKEAGKQSTVRLDDTAVDGRQEERGSLQNRAVAALKLLKMALVMLLQVVIALCCWPSLTFVTVALPSTLTARGRSYGKSPRRPQSLYAHRPYLSTLVREQARIWQDAIAALLSNSGISNDTDLNPDVNSLTTSRQRQSDDKQPESVDGLALATRVPGLAKTTYRL
ncbi:hypothetical protein GE21DRAFT_1352462 [Neurospora crassa]|nr:hypothetical protein GE21DRAFT_1352462 [Neurospora crassa]